MLQDNVEHLGPYGPLFFVAVMVGAEMVPLFPTQPLTIASGLLFGGPKVNHAKPDIRDPKPFTFLVKWLTETSVLQDLT